MSGSRSQPLPAKEDALFRQLVKSYESKHYKKAIKTADQVMTPIIDPSCILNPDSNVAIDPAVGQMPVAHTSSAGAMLVVTHL